MADKYLRIKLGSTRLDLPAPAEALRAAAGEGDLNEINLTDVHYQALNEQGEELLIALSPYESVAAANLACTLLAVPGVTASMRQVAESARSLLPPQQTETMSFYFPLAINIEDEDGNLKEGDRFLRLEVEDDICAVLRDSAPEGENMARHMGRCSQALRDKVASAVWDAGKYGGDVYGVVRCELRAPLTAAEKQELAGWIRLQNVGGIGETAEQMLIQTEYQELYLSFNCNGYSVFGQKQFEDHINGRTPEMEPDQITFYCPLTVQLYDDGDETCEDLVEVDNCYLDCHEDKVRAGLRAYTGDINMAD